MFFFQEEDGVFEIRSVMSPESKISFFHTAFKTLSNINF